MVHVFANASRMKNLGKREAHFKNRGSGGVGSMELQVADVQKPLASVRLCVEQGTTVVFCLGHVQMYIESTHGKELF